MVVRGCAGEKGSGAGELCAEGGCGWPEARPLQGSVAERETRQVHPSHAHSLSHHCRRFLAGSDFIAVLIIICAPVLKAWVCVHQWRFMHAFTVRGWQWKRRDLLNRTIPDL